jgi:short-chain fatty acids transporter
MNKLISGLVRAFVRWMPDAFTVTLLLTLVTFALAITVTGYAPRACVTAWGDGFWSLLTFTNQITLTLLLGYVLANTKPMRMALQKATGGVRTPFGAYVMGCVITAVCSLLSWGLGLIVAGVVARAIGESCRRKGIRVHYPLLVSASFAGFVVWHQGLTSAVALALASSSNFLQDRTGIIPTTQTIFTAWNIGTALFLLITLPPLMALIGPRKREEIQEIPENLCGAVDDGIVETATEDTPAGKMEQSRLLNAVIAVLGIVFLGFSLFPLDRFLELDRINFIFLILGMVMAGSPAHFVRLVTESGRVAAPMLVLYPFYAGIRGLMADSGLAAQVVEWFVANASAETLPILGFFSGGLVNMFIPSAGGQWAVQGPIMVDAAIALKADIPRVAMSVAFGDQWTNLIQPLVLIPVVLISGLKARQVMGYMLVALLWSGLVFAASIMFF